MLEATGDGWRITGGRRQFEGQSLELAALSVRMESESQQCGQGQAKRNARERLWGVGPLKGKWALRGNRAEWWKML